MGRLACGRSNFGDCHSNIFRSSGLSDGELAERGQAYADEHCGFEVKW